METTREEDLNLKQRHGCVTTWLILMIVINSLTAITYLFAGETISQNLPGGISNTILMLLALMGICNVIFSIMLLKWKIFGFWGFLVTSIAALTINLSNGIGVGQSLFGLLGIFILYGVFQIKKKGITAWSNLE